jgi:squalene-associated FAD-dependent desaturase
MIVTNPGVGAPGRVHVIGAGLAGLAAAVDLAAAGYPVTVYEAGMQAGGRCRSFFDNELGVRIDNGNHLLLSGNLSAMRYIDRIGALSTFEAPGDAVLSFADIRSGERWSLRPSRGQVPWWLLSAKRRVPGTRAWDYLAMLRLRRARGQATVASAVPAAGALYARLLRPLAVAALNTAAEEASAALLWHVLAETLGRGAAACRPMLVREGLSESLVDPALAFLDARGATIRFGARLKALTFTATRVTELTLDAETVALAPRDTIVLAVPAAIAARIVPELVVPSDHAPIVNAHYLCHAPPGAPPFLGLIGGTAEWVFCKREVVSVTVSAADRIVEEPAEQLRRLLWRDVAAALGLAREPVPPSRIIKERRATFRATPAQLRRRPAAATRWNNLHLAGDYVDTGLPATIEGAIRSGVAAASRIRHASDTLSTPVPGHPPGQPFPKDTEGYQRALP